jgi:ATP-binding protein involved in chromosome partitioning
MKLSAMTSITQEKIFEELRTIPLLETNVADANIVTHISIENGRIGYALEVAGDNASIYEDARVQCIKKLEQLPGVEDVTIVLTQARTPAQPQPEKKSIPGVKRILAIASGKGGVGKSTVAVTLAKELAKTQTVAILDADIYGPSIPLMLGSHEQPQLNEDKKMIPLESDGIQFISIGNLVSPEQATVWRGSMATKALFQLFQGTAWNNVDTLIVDMPPGTGDIQLSITKNYVIDAALLVSTPHDLALADVRKGANMFEKVNVPILGIVENMSYFETEDNKKHHIFGQPQIEAFAKEHGYKFLGDIPVITPNTSFDTVQRTYSLITEIWNT